MRSIVHVTSDAPVAGTAATDTDNEAMKNRLNFHLDGVMTPCSFTTKIKEGDLANNPRPDGEVVCRRRSPGTYD
jgi:hypothetical protein